MRHSILKVSALVLLSFSLISVASAQNQNQKNKKDQKSQGGASLDQEKPDAKGGASKDELKAYKEVYDARGADPAHLIEVGEGFLAKYPMSIYAGAVYSELASAYLNTNQPDKMVTAGTKAVEINPDNVDVLPLLAWAIPRRITAQTPDAAQQLDQGSGLRQARHPAANDDAQAGGNGRCRIYQGQERKVGDVPRWHRRCRGKDRQVR